MAAASPTQDKLASLAKRLGLVSAPLQPGYKPESFYDGGPFGEAQARLLAQLANSPAAVLTGPHKTGRTFCACMVAHTFNFPRPKAKVEERKSGGLLGLFRKRKTGDSQDLSASGSVSASGSLGGSANLAGSGALSGSGVHLGLPTASGSYAGLNAFAPPTGSSAGSLAMGSSSGTHRVTSAHLTLYVRAGAAAGPSVLACLATGMGLPMPPGSVDPQQAEVQLREHLATRPYPAVLVIDDTDRLHPHEADQAAVVARLAMEFPASLRLLLVGLPGESTRLASVIPGLASPGVTLRALHPQEASELVHRHLSVVGYVGPGAPLTAAAMGLIASRAQGLPAKILAGSLATLLKADADGRSVALGRHAVAVGALPVISGDGRAPQPNAALIWRSEVALALAGG